MMSEATKVDDQSPEEMEEKPSIFSRLCGIFGNRQKRATIVPASTPATLVGSARIAPATQVFELRLGNVALEFELDLPMSGTVTRGSRDWIVHVGDAYFEGVPEFLSIRAGETVLIGRVDDMQTRIFGFDRSVAERHVKVSNVRGSLTVESLEPDRATTIAAIASDRRAWNVRRENLKRLPGVLGRPLTELDGDDALEILREVNDILAAEAYREPNDDGVPGGIIKLPDDKAIVILGDIHTQMDNLLRVITEGGLLAALERDDVCMVFLGDLVHCEEPGELERMDTSILILDIFCTLKRRFPENIFCLRGNHEDFSPESGKGGVPQGVLLRRYMKERRGAEYVAEIERLFDGLAYIAQGMDFAACHGGPVRSRVTRDAMVNIRRYPGLQNEVVWNRLRQAGRLNGYGKGSVKRFRRMLGLSKEAPVIVGHTPMSATETLWRDVGGIKAHHIVYSAHTDRLAIMVMRDGEALALEFTPEPALDMLRDDIKTSSDTPGQSDAKGKAPPAEAEGAIE